MKRHRFNVDGECCVNPSPTIWNVRPWRVTHTATGNTLAGFDTVDAARAFAREVQALGSFEVITRIVALRMEHGA